MLLKIFVKRRPHGELCTDQFEYCEGMHEAAEIVKAETDKGFLFMMNGLNGEQWQAECRTLTHGYSILNNAGIQVDRYVTAIDDYALKYSIPIDPHD